MTGCEINEADVSEDAMNTDIKFTATCKATDEGTVQLRLSGDTTTEDSVNTEQTGAETITIQKRVGVPDTKMNSTTFYVLGGVTIALIGLGVVFLTLKKKNKTDN